MFSHIYRSIGFPLINGICTPFLGLLRYACRHFVTLRLSKICKIGKFVECFWKTFSRSVRRYEMCIQEYGRLQYGKPIKVTVSSHWPKSPTATLQWQHWPYLTVCICSSFLHCWASIHDFRSWNRFSSNLLFGVLITKILSDCIIMALMVTFERVGEGVRVRDFV